MMDLIMVENTRLSQWGCCTDAPEHNRMRVTVGIVPQIMDLLYFFRLVLVEKARMTMLRCSSHPEDIVRVVKPGVWHCETTGRWA